jgi:MipA family protein
MEESTMRKIIILLTVLALLCGSFSVSFAQEGPIVIENVPNVVGLAVGVLPDYVGSDDYTLGLAPFARFTLPNSERYLMLNVTELYFNMLNHPVFRFGPVLNYRFGRDDDVDDNYVKRMEEIDGTFEAGAFFGIDLKINNDKRNRFVADVELLFDIGNEYDGMNGTVSARYWHPFGRMFDGVIGVAFQFADDKFVNKYFGVDSTDSALSGLPFYHGDGGVTNFRVVPGVVMHLSEQWHLAAGLRYQRITGDSEDSPVVSMRGDADQWVFGLGAAYSW